MAEEAVRAARLSLNFDERDPKNNMTMVIQLCVPIIFATWKSIQNKVHHHATVCVDLAGYQKEPGGQDRQQTTTRLLSGIQRTQVTFVSLFTLLHIYCSNLNITRELYKPTYV